MSNTSRIFRNTKIITYKLDGIIADAIAADVNGNTVVDISNVNWQRIVMEWNIASITGTNVNFKMLTTNDPTNTGGATTDTAAKMADNSTAMASGTQTSTGRGMIATGKIASTGATASNIGKFIELFVDITALTVLTGNVWIYVEGQ